MIPLMIAFGAYLYVTRDEGFRFDEATKEHREAFVERQAAHWATKSGLTGFGVADQAGITIGGDARSAMVTIQLVEGSPRRIEQDELRARACDAYNSSPLPNFDISVTARVLKPDGSPAYWIAANPGRCGSSRLSS